MIPADPQDRDPQPTARGAPRFRLFTPILAGASLRDRTAASLGALTGIGITAAICGLLFRHDVHLPLIVAPIGASAVLLFAVPASPLAQPWPIIGGNTLSAFIGLLVAHVVPEPALALGLALGLAILAMSVTCALHPPGGAAALTAALGGPLIEQYGYWFPLAPVALNSALLVVLGILFHRFSGHAYPHKAPPQPNIHRTQDQPPRQRASIRPEDIDAALAALHETFDIDRNDLEQIVRQVEQQALMRTHGDLLCRDLMSRDVISVSTDDTPERARQLLLDHKVRVLPVLDADQHLIGIVGLRELAQATGTIGALAAPAVTAVPEQSAMRLVQVLSDGHKHAAVIIDDERRVLGLITQTDLLAALARQVLFGGAPIPDSGL
ncbi:MAG TPA: HPP family protein [Alphaproteobacteria bacterium]|nr:HPP family protein [Alphaproteobacteria bacterium]